MNDQTHVILLEDDDDLRGSLVQGLELLELQVTGVGTALSFYQTLSTNHFDVAVVDLGLPDQDGYEVVKHLRNETAMGIIILTARDALQDRVEGYDAGADFYFIKPTDSQELAAAITNLAQRLRAAVAEPIPHPANGVNNGHNAQSGWVFNTTTWSLYAPNGRSVRLTSKEYSLIDVLLSTPGATVARPDILSALKYQYDDSGNRALEALVRRLRAKVSKELGCELPLHTVHAAGYALSAVHLMS